MSKLKSLPAHLRPNDWVTNPYWRHDQEPFADWVNQNDPAEVELWHQFCAFKRWEKERMNWMQQTAEKRARG